MRRDVGQESHKFGRGMTLGSLVQDLTRRGVESGVQRQRAVPLALELMTFGASRRQRRHRILAVQHLDRCLLIRAEHHRVLRRVEVQPNHVCGLGLEIRVVGGQIAFHAVGLDAVRCAPPSCARCPHPVPPARTIASNRLPVLGMGQHPRFYPVSHLVALASAMAGEQASQPIRRNVSSSGRCGCRYNPVWLESPPRYGRRRAGESTAHAALRLRWCPLVVAVPHARSWSVSSRPPRAP